MQQRPNTSTVTLLLKMLEITGKCVQELIVGHFKTDTSIHTSHGAKHVPAIFYMQLIRQVLCLCVSGNFFRSCLPQRIQI